jgi:hypothetical protein
LLATASALTPLVATTASAAQSAQDYNSRQADPGYYNGQYNDQQPPPPPQGNYSQQPSPYGSGQYGQGQYEQPPPNEYQQPNGYAQPNDAYQQPNYQGYYNGQPPPPPPPGGYGPPPGQAEPPPPGGQAYDERAQQADQVYAQQYQDWAARYCVDQRNNNVAAGAVIGGVFGALLGAGVAGRHSRGAGAAIGGALGAGTGAAVGASQSNSYCPPGYVLRAGAPPFAYAGPYYGGPYYGGPGWYNPWVWYGGRWTYYPYRSWYWHRHGYGPGWRR